MNQDRQSATPNPRFFHPAPAGSVAHDLRMAHALEESLADELTSVASASYRSMLCESCDRRLSEILLAHMQDGILHFRLLGEAILALGGNPSLRTQVRVETLHRPDGRYGCEGLLQALLAQALRDKRRSIDRYQTLLGRSEDRVVRSLLLWLIGEEQRHAAELEAFQNEWEEY